jgi:two-component system, cell cycle sensor histidine kinase and response regulator CckA
MTSLSDHSDDFGGLLPEDGSPLGNSETEEDRNSAEADDLRAKGIYRVVGVGLVCGVLVLMLKAWIYNSNGAWQVALSAAGTGTAMLCLVFAGRQLLRDRLESAALTATVGPLIAGVLTEVAFSDSTVLVATTGTALILSVGLLAFPKRMSIPFLLSFLLAILVVAVDLLLPVSRFDPSASQLLTVYLLAVAALSITVLVWLIFKIFWMKGTIQSRMAVAFVLLVLLPAGAVSINAIVVGLQSGKRQCLEQLESVAALKESEIRTWARNMEIDLLALAEDDTHRRAAELLSGKIPPEKIEDERNTLRERFNQVIRLTKRFDEMFLMSRDGTVVLSTKPAKENEYRGLQDYFKQGLKDSGTHVQTVAYSPASEDLNTVMVVHPVTDAGRGTVGVMCGRARSDRLNVIMVERRGLGESGETCLVTQNFVLMTPSHFPGYGANSTFIYNSAVRAAVLEHKTGYGFYEGYRGGQVVGVYRWVPELGVALLAERDRAEALRPLLTNLRLNGAIALVAALLAVAASLLFTRGLASRLSGLSDTATRVARGELGLTAEIGRDDEIGALAKAFNRMTEQLRDVIGRLRDRIDLLRRTEAALTVSEEKYRSIVENALDGIFQTTPQGTFVSANPALARILGFESAEELVGSVTSLADQVYTDPARREELLRLVQGQGKAEAFEVQLRRKDGSLMWGSLHARCVYGDNGRLHLIEGIVQDITARRRAEEELRESEEKFRSLFNAAPELIHLLDMQGTVLQTNPAAAAQLGYTESEIAGRSMACLIVPQSRSGFARQLESALETGYDSREVEVVRSDGSTMILDSCAATIRNAQGAPTLFVVFQRDVTERKLAEERIRQQNVFLKEVLESLTHPFYVIDAENYGILMANSAAKAAFASEGSTCYALAHGRQEPCETSEHACPVVEVKKTGKPVAVEHTHYNRAGDPTSIEMHAYPLFDNEGRVTRIIEYALDVSDRKLLEERLRQSAKMEAIGRLAGGVAHDFNNLLTVMIGYSDMLLGEMPGDHQYRGKIVHINRAAERAAALTRQLLAFSRKQVLEVRVLNLNAAIGGFQEMLRRLLGEDIEFTSHLDPHLGMARCDPNQIEQILMNLAVNARDAMPAGGRLSIETANVILDADYARRHPEVNQGPHVMIAVSDTGVGMDAETRSRVFEPFFTTKEKGGGTGLGLATVFGIVKQHQGHISVYSEPGIGTTFKIYFPLIEVEDKESPIEKSEEVSRGQKGRGTVLVVEDEEIVRDLACEALNMLGYSVLAAATPAEAVRVSLEHGAGIDLLLTDVVLPRMDGRTLYGRLSERMPRLKVLYMSGYTGNFIVRHGVLYPGVHFIQKPFTVEKLAQKVEEVLEGSTRSSG